MEHDELGKLRLIALLQFTRATKRFLWPLITLGLHIGPNMHGFSTGYHWLSASKLKVMYHQWCRAFLSANSVYSNNDLEYPCQGSSPSLLLSGISILYWRSLHLFTFTLFTSDNCIWLFYLFCVWWMLLTVLNDLIERMVKNGDRPSLDAITGPADLVSFATKWIPLCWHQSPDERPSFDGKKSHSWLHLWSIRLSVGISVTFNTLWHFLCVLQTCQQFRALDWFSCIHIISYILSQCNSDVSSCPCPCH